MKIGGLVLGIILALVAHVLGLGLAAAGHGWVTAFFASFALWIFLPLTFSTVPFRGRYPAAKRIYLLLLIAIALAADAALIIETIREGTEYFWNVFDMAIAFVGIWLFIWLSWQVVAAFALIRGPERIER